MLLLFYNTPPVSVKSLRVQVAGMLGQVAEDLRKWGWPPMQDTGEDSRIGWRSVTKCNE